LFTLFSDILKIQSDQVLEALNQIDFKIE